MSPPPAFGLLRFFMVCAGVGRGKLGLDAYSHWMLGSLVCWLLLADSGAGCCQPVLDAVWHWSELLIDWLCWFTLPVSSTVFPGTFSSVRLQGTCVLGFMESGAYFILIICVYIAIRWNSAFWIVYVILNAPSSLSNGLLFACTLVTAPLLPRTTSGFCLGGETYLLLVNTWVFTLGVLVTMRYGVVNFVSYPGLSVFLALFCSVGCSFCNMSESHLFVWAIS